MYYPTNGDYIIGLLIVAIGLLAGISQANALRLNRTLSLVFVLVIFALGYVRFWQEVDLDIDSVGYYIRSIYGEDFAIGTSFVPFFTQLLTQVFGLSYFCSMLAYCLFSILAAQLFYATFLRVGGERLHVLWKAGFAVLTLTSVGYWAAGISKDSFVFLGIALFCWAFTKQRRRVFQVSLGIALVTVVRPHIGVLMVFAVGMSALLSRDSRSSERILVTLLGSAASVILVPIMIHYVGFGEVETLEDIGTQLDTYSTSFQDTAGYVDLSQMSLPLQIVTYLFRPFLWEAGSALQLAAAAQNAFLTIWLVMMGGGLLKRPADLRSAQQLTYLVLALSGLILLAMTTANIGISTRQKWTVVLPLLLAIVHAWTNAKRPEQPRQAERLGPVEPTRLEA